MTDYVIGLDLSLTSTGVCAMPVDWADTCDACRLSTATFKIAAKATGDKMRAWRLETMSLRIGDWVHGIVSSNRAYPVAAVIEGLPTHAAFSIVPLAELHGLVRVSLFQEEIETMTSSQSDSRKLICGKGSGKGVKELVLRAVRSCKGLEKLPEDECMALVAANWALKERGHTFVSVA